MSIRPVVLNGMIQRTDDVGQIKQNEIQKPVVDQQNIQQAVQKKEEGTVVKKTMESHGFDMKV